MQKLVIIAELFRRTRQDQNRVCVYQAFRGRDLILSALPNSITLSPVSFRRLLPARVLPTRGSAGGGGFGDQELAEFCDDMRARLLNDSPCELCPIIVLS